MTADHIAEQSRRWREVSMTDVETRLLEVVEQLILDVARIHPRVTQEQVALWLARVVVGNKHART